MNLQAALDDLKTSIEGLSFKPKVVFETQDKGSKNLVSIVPDSVEEEYRFGEVKRFYNYQMRLYLSGPDSRKPATVLSRCSDINDAIIIDRKRGGNALTTIPGDWSEETNDGRNLVVMLSEAQIQLIENC